MLRNVLRVQVYTLKSSKKLYVELFKSIRFVMDVFYTEIQGER